MTIWLLIAGGLAACGVLLLVLGLRGRRVNDHPICRKCGYDLSGQRRGDAGACPECGVDLGCRGAVRIGQRKRRTGAVRIGAVLLLIGLGGGGIVGWQAQRGFNWNTVKPYWWLRSDALGGNPAIANAAIREMIRRTSLDKWGSPEQQSQLVEIALTKQADLATPWNSLWGDLIHEAWTHGGGLTADQQQRFARQAFGDGLTLSVRSTVHSGTAPWMRVTTNGCRVGTNEDDPVFLLTMQPETVIVGTRRRNVGLPLVAQVMNPTAFRPPSTFGIPFADPPATYAVTVRCRMKVLVGAVESGQPKLPAPNDANALVAEWQQDATATMQVVDASVQLISLIDDAAKRHAMQQGSDIRSIRLQQDRNDLRLDGRITLPPCEISVAYRYFIRAAGREWLAGDDGIPAGGTKQLYLYENVSDLPHETTHVDVILRPSVETAERLIEIGDSILGGEIVIKDVPLEWPGR